MFERLKQEIQDIYERLGASAGMDANTDNEYRGRIAATKALITIEFSDISDEVSDD